MTAYNPESLRLGVVGLGRAFTLMLPTFVHDSRIKLVGATDPIAAAKSQFASDFGAPIYESIEALCAPMSKLFTSRRPTSSMQIMCA